MLGPCQKTAVPVMYSQAQMSRVQLSTVIPGRGAARKADPPWLHSWGVESGIITEAPFPFVT